MQLIYCLNTRLRITNVFYQFLSINLVVKGLTNCRFITFIIFPLFYRLYRGQCHKSNLGINLLTLFCKLDRFINIKNIYLVAIKRSSLQKEVR